MRSKEVEKAINDLMFIVVKDIYCNEIRIDKTKIIKEYNESVSTVLNYIEELEYNNEILKKLPNAKDKLIDTLEKRLFDTVDKEILRKINANTDTWRDFTEEVLKLL